MENGKYITKEFRSDEDVWSVINLIIEETNTVNKEQGKSFDVASSVSSQIHFFACINRVLSQKVQNDIARYLYCDKFKMPAYKGSYGDQPYRWVKKSIILGNIISKKQKKEAEKQNG